MSAHADSLALDQSKAQLNRAYQQVYEQSKKAQTLEERRAARDRIMGPAMRDLQINLTKDSDEQVRFYQDQHAAERKTERSRLLQKFARRDPKYPGDPRAKGPTPASAEKSVPTEAKPLPAATYEVEPPVETIDGSEVKREIEFK